MHEAALDSPVGWAGKPYRAITEVGEAPGSVLVVPVGSIEQHGHHMPVATDTILAEAVATRAAEAVADDSALADDSGRAGDRERTGDGMRTGDGADTEDPADGVPVLVAPPLYPGFSPHHRSFGGTLSLGFEHLLAAAVDTVETGLDSGFDGVLLVNGHGGNAPLIGAATAVLGDRHTDALIHGLTYFELAAPFVDEIRDSAAGGMGHAGEFETSLMLHLRPELVDEEAMTDEPLAEPYDHALSDMFEGGPLSVYRPFEAYTSSGTIGEPSLATAAKGERFLEGLVAELAAILTDVHEATR